MSNRAGRSIAGPTRKLTVGGVLTLLASVALAAASTLLAQAGAVSGQGQANGIERAIAVQEAHTDEFLIRDGVVGTAVGFANGAPAVAILTDRGGVRGIPRSLDGIPTIVRNIGPVRALAPPKCGGPPSQRPPECFAPSVDPTARFERPVPIGVSTGHPDITAGTIGARVTDGTDVFALSNNHVYANENLAGIGDPVIQPGTIDGGTSTDTIGTLADYEPIRFGGSDNVMDAAVALSETAQLGDATPSDGYGAPAKSTMEATLGLDVVKYGRTTGQTSGQVEMINATVNVGYDTDVAKFVDQIVVTPGTFSAGGDSGSLVVSASTRQPVGLLFAGSSTRTIVSPIAPILSRFGVSFGGASEPPPPPPTGEVTISSLSPSSVTAGSVVEAQLSGTGFVTGATVAFLNGSGPSPAASGVSVSSDGMTIDFTLEAKSGGPPRTRTWDVRVTNPDGSTATLSGGLTITPP